MNDAPTNTAQTEAPATDARTIPQGSLVTPREPIAIGRMKAHPGQMFWVTDSTVTRPTRGAIHLARSGQNAGNAKAFSFDDFARFFSVVSDLSAR